MDAASGASDASDAPLDAGFFPDSGHPPVELDAGGDGEVTPLPDAGPVSDAGSDAEPPPEPAMCSDLLPENAPAQLGSPDVPFEHALADGVLEGDVDWRGRAFIRLTGVTVGQRYAVALHGHELDLSIFADDETFTSADCSVVRVVGSEGVCHVTATRTVLDLTIHARRGAAAFTLSVLPAFEPEGSMEAPVQLAAADFPVELSISAEAPSFYEITGLTAATTYVVTGSGKPRLTIADTMAWNSGEPQLTPNGAIGVPESTTLLVSVQAPLTGEPVTLELAEATYTSEGTIDAPIALDRASALPYQGEVGWAFNARPLPPPRNAVAESFYAITGLLPGSHAVKLTAAESTLLRVYGDDAAFGPTPCYMFASTAGTAECSTRISGSTIYVRVTNQGGSGSPITLDVASATYQAEGTEQAPVQLDYAQLPYAGKTQHALSSYYEISGLTPSKSYVVKLTDLTSELVHLEVRDLFTPSECDDNAVLGTVVCRVTPGGSSVQVRVSVGASLAGQSIGGSYVLSALELDDEPAGTREAPIELECAGGRYDALVSEGSYYRITGLEPGVPYIIEAGPSSGARFLLEVADESGLPIDDGGLCLADGDVMYAAHCYVSTPHGSLLARISGGALGSPIELRVREPYSGSYGSVGAPLAIDFAELPHESAVATASPSYYAITGLTPGAPYALYLTTTHETLFSHFFADAAFTDGHPTATVVDPGFVQAQHFTPESSTQYVEVMIVPPSDWYTRITLDVIPQ